MNSPTLKRFQDSRNDSDWKVKKVYRILQYFACAATSCFKITATFEWQKKALLKRKAELFVVSLIKSNELSTSPMPKNYSSFIILVCCKEELASAEAGANIKSIIKTDEPNK